MLLEDDKKDIAKMRFALEIGSDIKKLEFQRKRIFEFFLDTPGNLDADFYMILLKRSYRRIVDEQHDSRVANLKGEFLGLHKKIQMRNDFEHGVNLETFPHTRPGIIAVGGVVINDTNPHIVSGNQQWLLNEDHERFKELMKKFAELYPFALKPKQKTTLMCRVLKKFTNRYCKNR